VYPGKGDVLDSIRSEAMLEGIQDYELLGLLACRDRAAAEAIVRKLVWLPEAGGVAFDETVDRLREARRLLLEALGNGAGEEE